MSSERGNARRQFLKASGLAAVALSTAPLRAGRAEAMLGLPGAPIEWIEGYKLSDKPFAVGASLYTHDPYTGGVRAQ
jgi:hypothetical protein